MSETSGQYGGSGSDNLVGTSSGDRLYGGSGNDVLSGLDGSDSLNGGSGNDVLDGGAGNDDLDAGSGNDQLFGGSGNDDMQGGSGNDLLDGGTGNDDMAGGSGNDTLWGRAGNDWITAGSGDDTANGNAGSDDLDMGAGNDLAIYNMSENAGACDEYDGGSGIDTLRLEFTTAQWLTYAVQNDVRRFLDFLNNSGGYYCGGEEFDFNAFNLDVRNFEAVKILVDGVEVSAQDDGVDARDDAFSVAENATIGGQVLTNDIVPDLVQTVSLVSGPSAGLLTFNADGTFTFDTNGAFDSLGAGQTATVTFTYKVTDADGDDDTATVTITVTGTNDAPIVTGAIASGAATEIADNAVGENSDTHTATGTVSFADADLSASHTVAVTPNGGFYRGTLTATITDSATGDGTGVATWNYAVADAALDDLAAGQVLTQTYTLTLNDGQGGTATQTITITLTGTNDGPTITSAAQAGSATEVTDGGANENATTHSASGAVTFADVDLIDTHGASFAPAAGGYRGTFSLGAVSQAGDSVGWDFSVGDSALDDLAAGQTLTQSYVVTIDDGNGGGVSQTVTITLTGTNDAPTITSTAQAGTITEIADIAAGENTATHEVSGAVTFADVDLTDTHSASFAPAAGGYIGSFALAAVNQAGDSVGWTFSVGDSALDHLADGESLTQSYDVTIDDGQGGTETQTVTVTITGTNDAPTITSAAQAGAITEIADTAAGENTATHQASGAVTFADVDLTDMHSASFAPGAGGYRGTFSLGVISQAGDSVGWTFSVGDSALDDLADGQSLTQDYVVTIDDGQGGTAAQTVTVTITGTNDAPTITSAAQAGAITEIADTAAGENTATHQASGAVTFADVDLTDTHGASFAPAAGGYVGSFALGAVSQAGDSVGWTFSVGDSALDHLADGESLTQSYDVTVDDGHGGSASQTVTVTITGTNDAPTIAAAATGGVAEAANELAFADAAILPVGAYPSPTGFAVVDMNHDGKLDIVSADLNSNQISVLLGNGDGSFAAPATFATASKPQNVAVGDVNGDGHVDVLTAHGNVSDGFSVLLGSGTGALGTPDYMSTGMEFTNDVDLADVDGDGDLDAVLTGRQTSAISAVQVWTNDGEGAFNLDATYTPVASPDRPSTLALADMNGDGDVDILVAQLDSNTVSVQLNAGDGTFASSASYATGGTYPNELAVGDVDGDNLADVVTVNNASGDVSVLLNNGSGGLLPPTIHAVAVSPLGVALSDVDGDGDRDIVVTSSAGIAVLTNDGLGGFGAAQSFSAGAVDANAVATGDLDGDGRADIVTANSSNNNLSVLLNRSDEPASTTQQATGSLSFADVDLSDGHTVGVTPQASGYRGTLSAVIGDPSTGDGSGAIDWTFSVDDSLLEDLAAGETLTQTYDVTVDDGEGGSATQTVTISITGANDGPVITSSVQAGAVTEIADGGAGENTATHAVGGSVTFADGDLSDIHSASFVARGGAYLGSLSLDPVNQAGDSLGWTFSVDDSALDSLAAGDVLTQFYDVRIDDGHGAGAIQTVTITITGTNDVPVIAGTSAASVQEDLAVSGGDLTASGVLSIADADAGESLFQPQASTAGTYGTFTLDAAGGWTYTASNSQAAIQGLAVDEFLTDSFTAVSADGSASQLVTVTINGSNDVVYTVNDTVDPSATKLGAGTELIVGSGIPASGFGIASQTDVGVELGFQVIYRQGPTVLSTDDYADGELHFTVNDGPQSIANGSQANQLNRAAWNFEYSIATDLDGAGNDLDDYQFRMLVDFDPTAAVSYRTFVLEPGGTGSSAHSWRDLGSGLVVIADDGGNANVTQNSQNYAFYSAFLTSPYGTANGFDGPAEFDIVLEAYRGGQLLADNHIVVDVVESNHAPTIVNGQDGSVTERTDGAPDENTATLSATGAVTFNDVDPADTHSASFVAQGGGYVGTFALNPVNQAGDSVTWTFSIPDSALDALSAGETITQSYDITIDDGQGGTATETVTVTITGTNDVPIIAGASTGSVQEDVAVSGGDLTAAGSLTITDADGGESLFQPQAAAAGTYGTFTLDAAGNWTYSASNGQVAIQGLAIDESLTDSFTAVSADGSASQLVTVTINGSNDIVYSVNDTVDPSATKLGTGTELIVGSGIPASGFGLANQTDVGVELGFQVIYRQGPTVLSTDDYVDGELHFTVNDGPQSTANGSFASNVNRAAWNFEYSIATDLDGAGNDLDDYQFRMLVDIDPTAAISYRTLVLEPGGTGSSAHQWRDLGSGLLVIADDGGNANVTQNSQNYAFYSAFLTSPYGTSNNFDGPAEFDIVLEAYRGGQLLADNHIVVDVVADNDAPTITSGAQSGAVTEIADLAAGENVTTHSAGGAVTFNDVNAADVHGAAFVAQGGGTGYRGVFALDPVNQSTNAAAWTFTVADSAIDDLAAGQVLTQLYDVTIDDGNGGSVTQTVTVTITGTNDAPVISSGNLLVNGSFEDTNAGGFYNSYPAPSSTLLPGWQIVQGGVQLIGEPYWQASDGLNSVQLKIPGQAGMNYGAIEQSFATIAGVQYLVEFDMTGNNAFGQLHTIQVSADGQSQNFSASGAGFSNANMGYTARTFSFTANDGSATLRLETLDPHLYGAVVDNFRVTALSGGDAGSVTEAANGSPDETGNVTHQAAGTVPFADVDLTDVHTVGVTPGGIGYRGTLSANVTNDSTGDGSGTLGWTFSVADSALDDLAAGQVVTQTYTLTVNDAHGGTATQTVTITITGAADNEAPAITSGAQNGSVTEIADLAVGENATTHNANGTIAFSDANAGDTHTASFVAQGGGAGYRGTFSLGAVNQGADSLGWTFSVADSVLDDLAFGQVLLQSYDVTIDDGNGGSVTQTVTVTITGTNDAPVINIATGNLLVNGSFETPDEGGSYVGYQANTASADDITGWLVTQNVVQHIGTFWQATDGNHSIQLNPFNANGAIEQTFATQAGVQYTVTFDLAGNWAGLDTHFLQVSADGQSQNYSVNSSPGNNNNDLDYVPQSFVFTANDASATLRLAATNPSGGTYGPIVDNVVVTALGGGPLAGSVSEAANGSVDETNNVTHQASGTLPFADVDLNDVHSVGVTATGGGVGYRGALTASVTNDTTGDGAGSIAWNFSVADSALDDLAAGQVVIQTYDLTIDDGRGGTANETVTITITGADDNAPPVVLPVILDAIAEDSGARLITQAELLAGSSDVDMDTLTASGLSIASGNGSLIDNGNGTWSYTPAANDDGSVSFNYTVSDGIAPAVATTAALDITPLNDAPVNTVPSTTPQFAGADFIMNSTVTNGQHAPDIAALPNGGFVATWFASDGGDTSLGVRVRLFNADGSPAGADFVANTTGTGDQNRPSVSVLPDGRFMVAWDSTDSGSGNFLIRARLFNADGTPDGSDFIVNSTTMPYNNAASVEVLGLPNGTYFVSWYTHTTGGDGSGAAVRGRIFDADGIPAGNDFVVNSTTANSQLQPHAALLADGTHFVVAWADTTSSIGGSFLGSHARVFNLDGTAVAADFQVNATLTGSHGAPSVVGLADGRFVATWNYLDTSGAVSVLGRLFNADGTSASGEFVVNSSTPPGNDVTEVVALANGGFVVAYMGNDGGDGSATLIRARFFDATATPVGADFVVDTTVTGNQGTSNAVLLSTGRLAFAWQSDDTGDGSSGTVRARLMDLGLMADEDTDLAIGGLAVNDIDAGGATITTTLAVENGTLTVLGAGGAAVSGSGTDTVTITGSQSQINATLSLATNVVYRGDLDFSGTDTLTMTTNDGGATGPTVEQDVDTVQITVMPVTDNTPPTITSAPPTSTATEVVDGQPTENLSTHLGASTVNFVDPDGADVHTATITAQGVGYHGTALITSVNQSANTVHWNVLIPDSQIDYLAAGQSLTQLYDLTIDDGAGGSATQTVTMIINGRNDAPVFDPVGNIYVERTGAANPFDGLSVGLGNRGTPALGDLDGDGDLDLVVGETNGTLNYFRNDGTAATPSFVSVAGGGNPFNGVDVGFFSAPAFADLDNDGDLDAMIGESSGLYFYYRNDGTATTPSFVLQAGAANPFNGFDTGFDSSTGFGDMDGDGDIDALLGASGVAPDFDNLRVAANNGTVSSPSFSLSAAGADPFAADSHAKAVFGDIDRDGDQDFIVGEADDFLRYFENTAGGIFVERTGGLNPVDGVSFDDAFNGEHAPALGDIDGDGDLDLLVGVFGGDIRYLENTTPYVTEADDGSADETNNVMHQATGSLAFGDVDLIDGHTLSVSANGAGYLGTLTASVSNASTGDGSGSVGWTFSLSDSAIDHLVDGQTLMQSYNVTISDGQGGTDVQSVSVAINGTDDAVVPAVVAANPHNYDMRNMYADLSTSGLTISPGGPFMQSPSSWFEVKLGSVTVWEASGDGFTYAPGTNALTGGTISGLSILGSEPGFPSLALTNGSLFGDPQFAIPAPDLFSAIAAYGLGNSAPLDAIFTTVEYSAVGVSGGAGSHNEVFTGGLYNDYFAGANGADTMYGGAGDDFFIGGADGGDTAYGGSGADLHQFGGADGNDVVADFSTSDGDVIDLRAALDAPHEFADLMASPTFVTQSGADVLIDFTPGTGDLLVRLLNVNRGDLQADDFLLPNLAPTATGDNAVTDEDTAINISVLTNDFDNTVMFGQTTPDSLTIVGLDGDDVLTTTTAMGATITVVGNQINYDPTTSATFQALDTGGFSVDNFQYTISDGHGGTATASVFLNINGLPG